MLEQAVEQLTGNFLAQVALVAGLEQIPHALFEFVDGLAGRNALDKLVRKLRKTLLAHFVKLEVELHLLPGES